MLVFIMPSSLFLVALWSPAGMWWRLLCGVLLCFVALSCGGPGPVWCLVVSIPDLYRLLYLE